MIFRIFSFCATPISYAPPPPPTTEPVSLHSKSLFNKIKKMARASGGCKYYAPTKLGDGGGVTRGKDQIFVLIG